MSIKDTDLQAINDLASDGKVGHVLDYVINMIPAYQRDAYEAGFIEGEVEGHITGHECGEEVGYGHGYNDGWHQGYMMGAERAEWEIERGR